MENDRRKSERIAMVAHIEVLDETTDTRLKARVSDISRDGCYLDMVNPLPPNTRVLVTITYEEAVFRARGRIVYSMPPMGGGVKFEDIEPRSLPVLQGWLAEAEKKRTRTSR